VEPSRADLSDRRDEHGHVLIIVMRCIDLSVGSMLSFIGVGHRRRAGLLDGAGVRRR